MFEVHDSIKDRGGFGYIMIDKGNYVVPYDGHMIVTKINDNQYGWNDTKNRFKENARVHIQDEILIEDIVLNLKEDWYIRNGPKQAAREEEKKKRRETSFKEGGSKDWSEEKEKLKEVIAYKYSGNGRYKLHESIIINGLPYFMTYEPEKEKAMVKENIEEPSRKIIPPKLEDIHFVPYEFKTIDELNEYIRKAKEIKSIAELYNTCKQFWMLYVDQDRETIIMLTVDTILTYFQDLFPVIHYSECIGGNDVGKSSIGYTLQYTGYRVIKATSISGANYFRILGTIEPGQCTIIEDEGDSISDDPDKVRILKAGYEYIEKVPKTNINTKSQEQSWYYVYCYKMILAEKSLREWKAKGLVDRTFTHKRRPGNVEYSIKEVVSPVINKSHKHIALFEKLLEFRKLMLCYRLINYRNQLPILKVDLKNRDKELMYPILQLFYGTEVFEEVKEAVKFFVKQRRERKSNSLEAAVYPILKELLYPTGKENGSVVKQVTIKFSDVWSVIIRGEKIGGHYDVNRPNEYESREFGKLYRNTLSNLITDVFGAEAKHSNNGSILIFGLEKFDSFESRFGEKDNDEIVKMDVSLESDGSDGSDGFQNTMGHIYKNNNNKDRDEVGKDSSHSDMPSQPSQPSLVTCPKCGHEDTGYWMKHHNCE